MNDDRCCCVDGEAAACGLVMGNSVEANDALGCGRSPVEVKELLVSGLSPVEEKDDLVCRFEGIESRPMLSDEK